MKLITFTVPCYNSAAYMDHCIETLLTAGEDAEIILVDDGSKDDTAGIIARKGLNGINLPVNTGLASAFRTAFTA